ncbi:hydantoinase B/oxoprolinase family protein [Gordonia terrae]
MTATEITPPPATGDSPDDDIQSELREFLDASKLFRGPELAGIRDHRIAPRDEHEEAAMSTDVDPVTRMVVRNRLQAATDEAREMLQHIASSPAAKWGDLVTCAFTATGDLSIASTTGQTIFSLVAHHPVKYIRKVWGADPTVGVRDGDVFMHNDARFGNVHQPDQSILLPIFHEGRLIAWTGAIIHEGENGAREPGGMPPSSESTYDDGLRISPLKVGENFRLRGDLVTFFQNSVRDQKLMLADMRARLAACMRVRQRLLEAAERYGSDRVIAALRETLEFSAAEARRRVRALPDGVTHSVRFTDSTLREPALLAARCSVTVAGDRLVIDMRGSAPALANRPLNVIIASAKSLVAQAFYGFVWPDLPRNQGVLDNFEFIFDRGSVYDAPPDVSNALSVSPMFQMFTAVMSCMERFMFNNLSNGNPSETTEVVADWWNDINSFLYGGLTQHGEFVGNVMTDVNGGAGGARSNRDGEHSIAPAFSAMADFGELEVFEDEVPVINLSNRKLLTDNQGFGAFRGGSGYQQIVTHRSTPVWGWAHATTGSSFPHAHGLFGGYGGPTYPLLSVSGVNAIEAMAADPTLDLSDIITIMNDQVIPGARYASHPGGLTFSPAVEGDLWMESQGAGGGYGDVLDRDPASVMADLRGGIISEWTAVNVYCVALDPETGSLLPEETERLREQERRTRLDESVPFDEFEGRWSTSGPGEELPFYGAWADKTVIHAGPVNPPMSSAALQSVFMLPGS